MSLRVLDSGLNSLLVDFGRPGSRSLGVPVGGAADRACLAVANTLVGNPIDAPGLEITLAGPRLEALDAVAGVVYGAPFEVRIGERVLRPAATFTLPKGDVLRIGGVQPSAGTGARAYLCVRGGFDAPAVLGSRSALEPIARGTELVCPAGTIATRFLPVRRPGDVEPGVLRAISGPQADWFQLDEFFPQTFTVSPQSNRMGLRLEGRPLTMPARELVSEPVSPGAVQVTREGRCIVLGVDGQTIGGYPKVAQVIAADLDALGQLGPGVPVRFIQVSLEQAELLYRQRTAGLHRWLMRIRTAITV